MTLGSKKILIRELSAGQLIRASSVFVLLLLSFLLVISFAFYKQHLDETETRINNEINSIANIMVKSLALPLWNVDAEQAQDYLKSFSGIEGICGAQVLDEGGNIFAETDFTHDEYNKQNSFKAYNITFRTQGNENEGAEQSLGTLKLCVYANKNTSADIIEETDGYLFWAILSGAMSSFLFFLFFIFRENKESSIKLSKLLRVPIQLFADIFRFLYKWLNNPKFDLPWQHIYFMLAAFNIVTIGLANYMTHSFVKDSERTMIEASELSELQSGLLELLSLSAAMNGPGNDVFESGDVIAERNKFNQIYKELNNRLSEIKNDLGSNFIRDADRESIHKDLLGVKEQSSEILAVVNTIFTYLSENENNQAAALMAKMDRLSATQINILLESVKKIIRLQIDIAKIEAEKIKNRALFDNFLLSLSAIMVILAVLYGKKLLTKMKDEENILVNYRDDLEQKVNEQTKDIQEALVAAEAATRAKSDFFANMSHELRTPLNAIIGMTQLVEDTKLDSNQKEMFSSVRSSGEVLLKIVNDILDVSKIEAGELHLEYVAFDVMQIIRHTARSFTPMATKKSLDLRHNLTGVSLPVLGDPTRFTRIINNLISNAINYTDGGHVSITVSTKDITSDSKMIIIDIEDTGIGIPEDKIERVFEKFTQADSSITRRYGGTGLGLTITKELVEMMGGEISVKSVYGQGSIFTIAIPFEVVSEEVLKISATIEDDPTTFSGHRVAANNARILIAEDQIMNQLFVKKLLSSLNIGHFVIVENGKEALREVQNNNYDMVLMDCHMPEMNGYDAAAAIRNINDAYVRIVPIIAMTANAMPEDEARCLECGMNSYISKPVDIVLFKKILSRWIVFDEVIMSDTNPEMGEVTSSIFINLDTLRANSMGDEEFMKSMINLFKTQGAEQIEALRSCCVDGYSESWVEVSHALKGTAGSVGAGFLREVCHKAQEMSDASKTERLAIVNEISSAFNEALKALILLGY